MHHKCPVHCSEWTQTQACMLCAGGADPVGCEGGDV